VQRAEIRHCPVLVDESSVHYVVMNAGPANDLARIVDA
jgi:hypothetical protein